MEEPSTILLVHGAWHGAWAWDRVRDLLTARGHRVETVDLPTVHAPDPVKLGMSDDAAAVAEAIDRIGGPVAVVAHSYGGVPVTQAAVGPTVTRVVYVCSFALDEGESLLGFVGGVPPSCWSIEGPLVSAGTAAEPPEALLFADVEADTAADAGARLRPQSMRAFEEPLTRVAWREHPSTYVVAERDAAVPVAAQEAMAARAGADLVRLDTSHSPFLSQPERLAAEIEAAVAPSGR